MCVHIHVRVHERTHVHYVSAALAHPRLVCMWFCAKYVHALLGCTISASPFAAPLTSGPVRQ